MRSLFSATVAATAFLVFLSFPVFAEIYKYMDKKGNEHYTDSLGSVPEDYRGKAVAIDNDLERNPGFVQETRPPQEGEQEKGARGIPFRGKISSSIEEGIRLINEWAANAWIQRAGILSIFIILFIVAGKVGKALMHRHIGTILRIIMTAAVLLLLFHAYL